MPLPSNPADEPTLKEALEGFAALPAVWIPFGRYKDKSEQCRAKSSGCGE